MSSRLFRPWLLFTLCLVVAGFFRLYLISSYPGGLFPDEAANGLDINLMEQGQLQPFYERGNGREALFFYLIWPAVKIFGRTPLAHHLVSALVGLAVVVATFFVTRFLWRRFRPETPLEEPTYFGFLPATYIALLSTWFIATSTWHTVLSRTAFRANLIPLFACLSLWTFLAMFLAKSRKAQILSAALFGICFAGGFYTYIAFRILALVFPVLFLWLIFSQPKGMIWNTVKSWLLPIFVSLIFFAVTIAPLAHYFYTHPGSFVGRSGQVSVFNPELNHGDLPGTVLEVTKTSLLAYITHGDLNWRHNISGLPFLPPMLSPLFLLGIVASTVLALKFFLSPRKHFSHLPHFALALWWWSMLVPVVSTAEGIPHGLRSIGTIPAVFIYAAYGCLLATQLAQKVRNGARRWQTLTQENTVKRLALVMFFVFLLSLPAYTYVQYFVSAYHSPENYYAFRSDLTAVSEYLLTHGNKSNTYLVLDKFSLQTVDYMTTVDGANPQNPLNQPYTQVDPERSNLAADAVWDNRLIWAHGLNAGAKLVFTQSSIFDIAKFKLAHPNSRKVYEQRNKFGQAVLAVYEMD